MGREKGQGRRVRKGRRGEGNERNVFCTFVFTNANSAYQVPWGQP